MADGAFEQATAVRPATLPGDAGDSSGGEHATFDVTVDGRWSIGDKPNGGYLVSAAGPGRGGCGHRGRGARPPAPALRQRHLPVGPRAWAGRGPHRGAAPGKRMSQVRARPVQDGTARVEATFTLGRLDPAAEAWGDDVPAPAGVTPDDECPRAPAFSGPGGFVLPIMEHVDLRLHPAVTGFATGRPRGRGEVHGWFRFADGRAPDPLSLLLAVDILPPATFDLGSTGVGPHLRADGLRPPGAGAGPLLVRHRAHLVEADMVDDACDVWDARGRLVAHATQLAGVRVAGTRPVDRT